jgi:hypothetical protein
MVPTPLTPPTLVADSTQTDKDAAKSVDDAAIEAHDQKVHEYFAALETYR